MADDDLDRLDQIEITTEIPDDSPDDLTDREIIQLTAKEHALYSQKQLVQSLQSQVELLMQQCSELRGENRAERDDRLSVREKLARYETADRASRMVFLSCTPAIILGSCLIGVADASKVWPGVGWGLVLVGAALQFLMGLFEPNRRA